MDRLREYLQSMKFKKRAVGGVDEEDVLIHIKKISDLAREELEEQARTFEASARKMREDIEEKDKAYETLTRKMQKDMDELQAQLEQSRTDCRQLREANGQMEARAQEQQGEAERYEKARALAEQEEKKYREKRQELLAAVDTLHSVKAEAEKTARQEIKAALQAEEESARSRMLSDIEVERVAARQELKQLHDEITALTRKRRSIEESLRREREQWKQHLAFFASRLEADGDDVSDLHPPDGR